MSFRKTEQNAIAFLRHENSGNFEKSAAEIDERNRRRDWVEFWLFLSVWMVITTVATLAVVLNIEVRHLAQ